MSSAPSGTLAREHDPLDQLAARMLSGYETSGRAMHHLGAYELPQVSEVAACLEDVRALLFPGFVGASLVGASRDQLLAHVRERLGELAVRLGRQLHRGLHHRCQTAGQPALHGDCSRCAEVAQRITWAFLEALPELRDELATDVQAALDGDPAATGSDEIVFCYPGLYAITAYRVAHRLLREGASIIPRMLTEHAHEKTGIDIHPGAAIGRSFFIDHGTGVVIGETTTIGERVRIYQGVTLGALSLPKDAVRALRSRKRHPTIEDEVVIYANATILGGDTVIGRGAVIGGNCWITRSVAPGMKVGGDVMLLGGL